MIRKICVGLDYKNGMHYTVGQSVLNGTHTIDNIIQNEDGVHVWVKNGDDLFRWKSWNVYVPIHFEYEIDF